MKKELYNKIKDCGLFRTQKDHPLWRQSFKMYMEETGDPVSLTCSKCYKKVIKWLKN